MSLSDFVGQQRRKQEGRVVLFDIETAPSLGYYWDGKFEVNVIEQVSSWHLLSFAWKVLGEKKIHVHSLPDYPGYEDDKQNDEKLSRHLWAIIDSADVVIAHNGDRFDLRKANARFTYWGITPPSPYRSIDTLKVARRHFSFNSNSLDDLAKHFGFGKKLAHTGWNLWKRCMEGDLKAWNLMRRYNKHDIKLLEEVYLQLRPWIKTHPNLAAYSGTEICPACRSTSLRQDGFVTTRTGKAPNYRCLDCGFWSQGPYTKTVDIRPSSI